MALPENRLIIKKSGDAASLSFNNGDTPLWAISATNNSNLIINPFNNSTNIPEAKSNSCATFERGTNDVVSFTAYKVYNAVFNDLADCITIPDEDVLEPGYCYCLKDGHYVKSSKYMDGTFIGIHSDTFGLAMGKEEGKNKLNAAVAGFVLVHMDTIYETGTPLTCTKDGKVAKASLFCRLFHPERIVGTFWKPENSDTWGPENIQVNGRHWIKVK